jgi:choline kinase
MTRGWAARRFVTQFSFFQFISRRDIRNFFISLMQCLILAAGVGNRLATAAGGKPKCYLPLGNETLLTRNLRLLRECGVTECVLVTGHQRERFAADFPDSDIRLVFNPFYKSTNVLVSVWCGLPFITGEFVYLHADTVFHPDILRRLVSAPPQPAILAADRKVCAEEEMKYKLNDGGTVFEINKTMPPAEAHGEFLGLARFSAAAIPVIRQGVERVLARGEFGSFFEAALQEMIDARELAPAVADTGVLPWREIDFPEDYAAAVAMFS